MKILVADDDRFIRLVLKKALNQLEYEIVEAHDGTEAWEILKSPEAPRLAILDWEMPGMLGPDICIKVRELDRSDYIYLLLVTGRGDKKDLIRGMESGADDYLIKPFETKELEVRLRAARRVLDLELDLQNELAERERTEHALADLNMNLEARVAERTEEVERLLAQKNAFINQLGHDLKTPLTPLLALLPKAIEKVNDEKIVRFLSLGLESARYMNNLVTNTLSLSRLNSPKLKLNMEELNLHAFVNTAIDMQRSGLKKAIELKNLVDPSIRIEADPVRFREVLDNLMSNSVKYTEDGGAITVEAHGDGDWINVYIIDTGMGMTEDQLSHVFEEFYKADESRHDRSSVGLGLTICMRIIEKHGGTIEALSEGMGRGTTMRFTFPSAKAGRPLAKVH
jgi:signal transduction histidine kinase